MDRNPLNLICLLAVVRSPPARVAWIETRCMAICKSEAKVATREGGVDRNSDRLATLNKNHRVATREGGVDRNTALNNTLNNNFRRHPRGWRG